MFVLACCGLAWFGDAPRAAAQVPAYDVQVRPGGIRYFVRTFPHFDVIYEVGLEAEAEEAGARLEANLPETQALFGSRRRMRMPVVLNRFNDRSNGFVTPFPFKQEIEGVSIRGYDLSPYFDSWLHGVVPHELTHAVQADAGRGFGVGSVTRWFWPDAARIQNLTAPRGMSEGFAVYRESQLEPHAGRLHFALTRMTYHAAMADGGQWGLGRVLVAPAYHFPLDRHYIGSGFLVDRWIARFGDDFVRRTTNFYYRFPFLGYGAALWYGTGRPTWQLSRWYRAQGAADAAAHLAAIGTRSTPSVLISERGLRIRRPVWLDDSTLAVHAEGYDVRPGLYRVDLGSGARRLIAHQCITDDYYFSVSADTAALYAACYRPDTWVPRKALAEVYRVSLAGGDVQRLTENGRVTVPAPTADGRIIAAHTDGQFNNLVTLDARGVARPLTAFARADFRQVLPSPTGGPLLAVLNAGGRQGLVELVDGAEGARGVSPVLFFEDGAVLDASWSKDGRFLLFASDATGVANVFALAYESGRLHRLTNEPYGALHPSLSPDGQTIAYVRYEHERYELATIPFDTSSTWSVPAYERAPHVDGVPLNTWLNASGPLVTYERVRPAGEDRPYRAHAHLRPRGIVPFVVDGYADGQWTPDTELGIGIGLGVEGADPLQRLAYQGRLQYQAGRLWGSLGVRGGVSVLRPLASVYTRAVGRSGGQRADEEQGLLLSTFTPVVLSSNVYRSTLTTQTTVSLRRRREIDGSTRPGSSYQSFAYVSQNVTLAHRVQQNQRDLAPNTGQVLSLFAGNEYGKRGGLVGRNNVMRLVTYLPLLHRWNQSIALYGAVIYQKNNDVASAFLGVPRGQRLPAGRTHFSYGIETIRPFWFVDRGLVLVPLHLSAVYAYGFAESVQDVRQPTSAWKNASLGGGLGVQVKVAFNFMADVRVGAAYLPADRKWVVVNR